MCLDPGQPAATVGLGERGCCAPGALEPQQRPDLSWRQAETLANIDVKTSDPVREMEVRAGGEEEPRPELGVEGCASRKARRSRRSS